MRILLGFFLMFLFCNAQSQNEIGLRMGVSFAKFRYYANDKYFLISDPVSNIEVGCMSFFKVGKKILFIAPEINYLSKGGALPDRPYRQETLYRQIEFALPVGVEFTVGKLSFLAKTGMHYGYMISGVDKSSLGPDRAIKFKVNEDLNRSDIGLLAGGGVSVQILSRTKILIDYRYRRSLNYSRDSELEDFRLSTKNIAWGIYLGCLFKI